MKKGLCTLVLMLMASASLFAQLRHEQQSQIGLRAGANFATIDDGMARLEGVEGEPWVPRFVGGIATSFWMSDVFAFAPEVTFNQRGYEAKGSDLRGDYTYTYDYNYIEIPLLFRATFGQQLLRGYLNLGPSVSYMISAKETATRGGVATVTKIDSEDSNYNLFEVGAAVGGGIHLNTGIGNFLIDLRYHTGLTNVQKDGFTLPAYDPTEQPEKYRTRYISTSLIFLGPARK